MSLSLRYRAALVAGLVLWTASACGGSGGDASPTGDASGGSSSSVSASADGSASGTGAASATGSPELPVGLSTEEQEAALGGLAAYANYLKVGDNVFQGGGRDPEPLRAVAVGTALTSAQTEAANLAQLNARLVGSIVAKRIKVTSVNLKTDPAKSIVPEVVISSCEDSSGVQVVDANGKDITDSSAAQFFPSTVWARFYPKNADHAEGWLIARAENSVAGSC